MILLLIAALLFLNGCDGVRPTNENLVRRAKVCQDAGFDIHVLKNGDGVVLDFQCIPKGQK